MIKATINNTIKFPKFVFTEDLEYIAEKYFIPYMQDGIDRDESINGGPFPALEKRTIEAKRRKGLRDDKLIETGELRKSFKYRTEGATRVIIYLNDMRKDIGYYLQVVGVGKKKKHFNFFGISARMEQVAINHMKRKLRGQLVNAR